MSIKSLIIRLNIVLFLVILSSSSYAQRNLKILFTDQFGDPASNIQVNLLVSKENVFYTKTTSNANGLARFNNLYYRDTIQLQVSDYRFLSTMFVVAPDIDSTNFVLDRLPLELTQINVNAERSPVEIRGDTMIFDVEAYRLGNETTLGDLINRIPELSLSDNGDIKFQGKTIDHLFIEGKDIFGGRQRSATDAISADDVSSIRLLQHYQGFGDIIGGFSNKVAVDVQLQEEAKARWLGYVEALAGSRKTNDLAVNLSRAGNTSGFNGVLNMSTAPGSQLSTRDFLNAKSSSGGRKIFDEQDQVNFTLDDLVPAPLHLAEGLQKSRALFTRMGYDRRINTRMGLRLNGLFNEERHDFAQLRTLNSPYTNRPNADTIIRVADSEDFRRRVAMGSAELNIGNISDTMRSRGGINIDFSYVRGKSQINRIAVDGDSDTPLNHRIVNSSSNLHGFLIHPERNRPYSQKTELTWQYDQNVSGLNAPIGVVLPIFIGTSVSTKYAEQQNRVRFLHTAKYDQDKLSGYIKASGEVHRLITRVLTDTSQEIRGKSWDIAPKTEAAINYRLGQHHIVRAILKGEVLRRTVMGQTKTFLPHEALLLFKRGVSPARFAQIRAITTQQMATNIVQSSGIQTAPRPFNISTKNANPFLQSRKYIIGADYFNRSIGNSNALIILTTNHSWVNDDQQQIFIVREEGWIETSFLPLRRSINTSIVLRGQLPLSKKLSISAGTTVIDTRQPESPVTGEFYRLRQKNYNVTTRIHRLGNIELNISMHANQMQQTVEITNGTLNDIQFNTTEWAAMIRYKLENRLEVKGHIGYRRSTIAGLEQKTSLKNYPSSLEISYYLKKGELPSLFIRGSNLINYNPRQQQEANLENFGINNTSFVNAPGYIQIGLNKRW